MRYILLTNSELYMNVPERGEQDLHFIKVDRGDLVLNLKTKEIHWCHFVSYSPDGIGINLTPGLIMDLKQKVTVSLERDPIKYIVQKEVFLRFEFEKTYKWKNCESNILEFRNLKVKDAEIIKSFGNWCAYLSQMSIAGQVYFDCIKDELTELCKTSPGVDFASVHDSLERARTLLVLGEDKYLHYFKDPSHFDFEPGRDDYDTRKVAVVEEDCVELLMGIACDLIDEGKLNGVIDKELHRYVDRDFGVKEQRVVNIQVDFNTLVSQLGNKGVVLSSIQCTQCGANLSLPLSGSKFYCSSCGSLIQVTDLFEKFKGILG